MTNNDFIDYLESRSLVPANIVRQLRAKAAQGDERITPKAILKYLVKKEIVSRSQAKQILETTLVVSEKAESSILSIQPLPELAAQEEQVAPVAAAEVDPLPPVDVAASAEPEPVVLLSPVAESESLDLGFGSASDDEEESAPRSKSLAGKGTTKKKKKKKKGKPGKNEWDSPLLLIGGGGLALLLIAGGVIYYLLMRENADELLKTAAASFEGGQFSQSISEYERFVANHSSHQDISLARVRLGMAKIWRDTERTTNFANALATTKQVLDQIEDEPAFNAGSDEEGGFSQAKAELSSLLTTIAKGLAQQASDSADDAVTRERVEQIRETLGLAANTKFVPQSLRQENELAAVQEQLNRVEARLQRGADLAVATTAMDAAIAAGDFKAAFAARQEVIKKHPALFNDADLDAKVLEVSQAELQAVKFVAAKSAAITTPAASPVVAEIALADRRGAAAGGPATPVVVRVDGGLYALNSADGALLWRRSVGVGQAKPIVLPNGLVVTPDAQSGELVAMEATSGKLAWRLPLEGALATPVILGERLLVSSQAGRLYVIEQASGELIGYVQFSQAIEQPPAVSERGDRIYVLGEQANLYTLTADKLNCIGVYYLGHAAGGAATPPEAILNKLVVADNSGAETCQIRVLALNDEGAPAAEAARHRLAGLVTTPLQVAGRRFATVTTQGQAVVFEIAAANDKSALTALASRDAQDRDQLARFSLLHDGHLWLAARELTKLAVLPTGNQLPVRGIDRDYRGDAFDYPLQAVGNLVIHARRPAGQGGVLVAAMDVAANKAMWETAIAVPAAGAPAIDAATQQIIAGSSSGAVYVLDREALTRRVQNDALHLESAAVRRPVFNDALDLGGGRLALAGAGVEQVIHFRPKDPRQQLREISLPGPLSGRLAAWGDAFAAATDVGQIALYGADDTASLGAPFQAELTPGKKFRWLPATALGEGAASDLIISDGVSRVYFVRRVAEPEPYLEAAASVDVGPSPLISPFAAVGTTAFVGNEAGRLARFTAPDLAPGEATDLGGRVAWGPFAASNGVLVATDAGELLMVGVDGAVAWRQKLAHGALGGKPLVVDGQAYLLHGAGGVSKITLADGVEAGYLEVGQSLTAGPVQFAGRLLVTAADGTLLVVNLP